MSPRPGVVRIRNAGKVNVHAEIHPSHPALQELGARYVLFAHPEPYFIPHYLRLYESVYKAHDGRFSIWRIGPQAD